MRRKLRNSEALDRSIHYKLTIWTMQICSPSSLNNDSKMSMDLILLTYLVLLFMHLQDVCPL